MLSRSMADDAECADPTMLDSMKLVSVTRPEKRRAWRETEIILCCFPNESGFVPALFFQFITYSIMDSPEATSRTYVSFINHS